MNSSNNDDRVFTYPLSVDPMRIVLALGRFMPAILLLAALGAAGGYFLDKKLVPEKNRNSVKNSLLATDIASYHSENAFRPRHLAIPVLTQLLFDPRVVELTKEPLGIEDERFNFERYFEVEVDYQSDIFTLIAHSYQSPEHAVEMSKAWTAAVIKFGKELQAQEVEAFTDGLAAEIQSLQQELVVVNSNLLQIASQHAIQAGPGVGTRTGLSYEELNNTIVNKQLDLNALQAQIAKFTRDIVAQSPRAERLKVLRTELNELLATYTAGNPLVIAKQSEIKKQEELIDRSMQLDPSALTEDEILEFTNTPLSNELYIKLLEARAQQFKLQEELQQFQRMLEARRELLDKEPGAKFALANLEQRQTELLARLGNLQEKYESGSYYKKHLPGYYASFQIPTVNDVYHQGYVKKYGKTVAIYAIAILAALAFASLLAVWREFRRKVWSSPLQTAIKLKQLPSLNIYTDNAAESFRELWLTQLSRQPAGRRHSLIAALGDLGDTENTLWAALVGCIGEDQVTSLVLDASDERLNPPESFVETIDPLSQSAERIAEQLNEVSTQVSQHKGLISRPVNSGEAGKSMVYYLDVTQVSLTFIRELLSALEDDVHVLFRWSTTPNANLSDLSESIHQYLVLSSPSHTVGSTALSRSRMFRNMLGAPSDLVLLDKKPRGLCHRFVVWFENAFFEWKKSQATS